MATRWCGIEDASASPTWVWFMREKETDHWTPLRKSDCHALNNNPEQTPIRIDNGRAIADPLNGTVRYNFYRRPPLTLVRAIWFVKDTSASSSSSRKPVGDGGGNQKCPLLVPMSETDGEKVEALYQKAKRYTDTTTTDTTTTTTDTTTSIESVELESILQEQVILEQVYDKKQQQQIQQQQQQQQQQTTSSNQDTDDTTNSQSQSQQQSTTITTTTNDDYRVKIVKVDDTKLVLRKCPTKWFFGKQSYDLQRGYGSYVVDGEEEELALGPVQHVLFVIHGVGEAMFSREDVALASLVDQMNETRIAIHKRQYQEWKKACEQQIQANAKAKEGICAAAKEPLPPPPNRIEIIPIEWYDKVHSSSNSLMKSLKATTLTTIPALRAIANDVVFDVLMYLTPAFCTEVIECVTDQINDMYQVFSKLNPTFGGKASLVGHSLGSVICWDLLSILKDQRQSSSSSSSSSSPMTTPTTGSVCSEVGYQHYASSENANIAENGNYGPSLAKPITKRIPFTPDFTLFLGSPIGLFLTLRGAHAVFDELRETQQQEEKQNASPEQDNDDATAAFEDSIHGTETFPVESLNDKISPFTLPSHSILNIFHPSDPVAYRIEPLLLPQDFLVQDIPAPLYLTRRGQDVRLHVKAMQLGDDIRKSFLNKSALSNFMTKATSVLHDVLERFDEWTELRQEDTNDDSTTDLRNPDSPSYKKSKKEEVAPPPISFPLGGEMKRIDYQLQPSVIDNEYVSSLLAHSTYFCNYDVIGIIIDLATGDKKEQPTTTSTTTNATTTPEVPGCIEVNDDTAIAPSPLPPKLWSTRPKSNHFDAAKDINTL